MTVSLKDPRIIRILEAALQAVEPSRLVQQFLSTDRLPSHSRRFLLGLGKAAEGMTRGAAEALGGYEAALVITKTRRSASTARFTVHEAGHPIPDERSVAAGQAALDFVSSLQPQDLLVCLISGGGSALVTAPVEGLSLEDVQALTASALKSGVDIEEINNLRRCLDRLKGGGLAAATRAQVLGIILSDVIGDRVEAIASGPTVPCPSDRDRATQLVVRLVGAPSPSLRRALMSSAPPHEHSEVDRIRNVIVGNSRAAAEGARLHAVLEGFEAMVLEPGFQGEAKSEGERLGRRLAVEAQTRHRPACLIAYGESTVTLGAPHGLGGRNQELALAATESLDGLHECMLISFATDGEDGPTDAAGAVVTGASAARARGMGMISRDYLARHDSHRYFGALGDLLRPGYTGTNVNDMVLLLAL